MKSPQVESICEQVRFLIETVHVNACPAVVPYDKQKEAT